MIIDQVATLPGPADRVWEFVMDIPAVSRCVPGVDGFASTGTNTYAGTLKVKVGPIGVQLQGQIEVITLDHEALQAVVQITASEQRLNSTVTARTTISVQPRSAEETALRIHTEAAILGKLGEFGQAVIRRKADQLVTDFARNAAIALEPKSQ